MLSTENIIIIIVSGVVCIAVYYCYTRISLHEQYFNNIHQRCQNLEIMLTQPSPTAEIDSILKKKSCKDGVCYIKPIIEETEEDDDIAQEEIDKILTNTKKKKIPLPKPPESKIEE